MRLCLPGDFLVYLERGKMSGFKMTVEAADRESVMCQSLIFDLDKYPNIVQMLAKWLLIHDLRPVFVAVKTQEP